MEAKNTRCALCIIPPNELMEYIQSVRKEHDSAYERWMPHINLFFPFVDFDKLDEVYAILNITLSKFPPFMINLKSFDYFKRKKDATTHLVPETSSNELIDLHQVIQKSLGLPTPNKEYHPHLTVGQFKKSVVDEEITKMSSEFPGTSFQCDKIYLITRDKDTPFKVLKEISLATSQ